MSKKTERTKSYLWFDQDQIDEQDNKIMLDIFVCKTLASRALCQADALSQSTIIGLTVCRVQAAYGVPTLDTNGHSWRDIVLVEYGRRVVGVFERVTA